MKTPMVKRCEVTECAYNRSEACHAVAVTIGDSHSAQCDTFCGPSCSTEKGGESRDSATVGACKVSSCTYNQRLECHAPGIEVGAAEDQADCLTFEEK